MKYRLLGNTGLEVSEIALGTVELGMNYGFRGSTRYQQPEPQEAIRVLHRAVEAGVNLIDTAPSYGAAEELIGEAFSGKSERPYIASKVMIPLDKLESLNSSQLRSEIIRSVEA